MGNRFLMAWYKPSEALLDQIFMQRWGLFILKFHQRFKRSLAKFSVQLSEG